MQSNHQNELESESRTKDVDIQCGKYFTTCVHAVITSKGESCTTEIPILSRRPTHLVDVYPKLVLQYDAST